MKKLFGIGLIAAMAFAMISCGSDGPLTASSAKNALSKEAVFTKNSLTQKFNVGFYEVSESQLDVLAKLQAAGVITFTAKNVKEYVNTREWTGGWYGSYRYVTKEVPHWFASVDLTDAGKKMVVEDPVVNREDIEKDFKSNKDFNEVVPQYMSETFVIESPTSTNHSVEKTDEPTEVDTTESDTAIVVAEEVIDVVEDVPQTAPQDKNSDYNAALSKVNPIEVNVLLGQIKIVKCKEVLCTNDMFEAGKGECKFIWKVTDKTPFGYVADNFPPEGYLNPGTATFVYYNDMGWTVEKFSMNE